MRDLAKRKRVMARSMELGHCICNPKKPCPCDVYREHDICPCAGERLEEPAGPVRLTDLVESAGCASKIDQASLRQVLAGLPSLDDPRVLVGMPAGDDAGVFQLDETTALVQTVDVFTPSVDEPYTFGQIAAANSLSDVYAMGGRPLTALSIVGFPIRTLPDRVLREILRGGIDKMTEAGVPVIGGHSINDPQIKAGFAVTGLIDPRRVVANAGARPGDRLILTKPLGTGIMAFAAQIGRAPAGGPEAAARSMASLNRRAAELMIEFEAHACTDVTGFGLAGHLGAMAEASRLDVEVALGDIPLLPGIQDCIAQRIIPGGVERNRESSAHRVVADETINVALLDVLFDPQTSGGLLIAVAEPAAEALLDRLRAEGMTEAAIIGRVLQGGPGRILVQSRCATPRRTGFQAQHDAARVVDAAGTAGDTDGRQEANPMSCCGDGHGTAGGVADIQAKFQEFLKAAGAPGALDGNTKRAIGIALSVLAKCEPCLKFHIKKAQETGFTPAEIDEAAWLAISFGGSPTMMFYNTVREKLKL